MLARLGLDSIRSRLLVNVTAKNILIASGCLAASYVLAKTVGLYLKKRQYRHIPGPPPENGIVGFFIGNMPELRQAFREGKVIGDVLVKWHETYGEVFKFQMFSKIIVVTSDKNTIKDVLIVKNYPKDRMNIDRIGCPMGERFLGNGLATEVDNERWRHRRAIYNPGFHRHVLVTFVGHFNQIVNSLLDKLRTKADGKTKVDLLAEINRATLDAIALIAFGMNTDSIMLPDSILNIYLSRILKTAFEVFLDPLYKYRPWNFGAIREFKSMIRYIRELGRKRILERVNAFKNNEHLPNDILTAILTSYKDGDLDIEAMTDDFVTFFVAGQETTANTVAFCFQELGKNPDVVKRAQEEIDRVLGKRTEVTYQDVSELKYCSAIFKEVLRLFPPAPQLFRYLTEPININGYNIPKNTPIWISTYINGRYEKFFKNALEFRPERFLKSSESIEVSDVENYVYFPFSLGPRNCIGQNFAQLEGIIVIAKLLQKFDFKLDPTQKFVCDQTLTLRPRDGTRIFLTLRDHS